MERIGPYLLVRTLGSGGMGVVHLAEDPGLGRQVALKVISPHLAEDPGFRARFTREAQALAALDSPHVVHVYAHGEHDGRLYLATQLVPDGDLGRMLEDHGAPPLRVGLDLVAQVAAGLSDAHAAGLVHRDIKPANVLLRRRDATMQAYLSDFGIARQVDDEPTRTGTVGTPTWMAPELHTGAMTGRASVASDVYSLGCLLWATLSGHAPYAGTTDYEVVTAHREQPVPQLEGADPLTREVNRILRVAMAKEPAGRYATAAAMRDDLRRTRALSADPPAAAPVPTPSWRGRGPLVAAIATVVLLLAGGIAYAATRGGDPAPSPTVTASTPAPTGGDLETATASLSEALVARGGLSEEQARCTAERWIEEAGLRAMVEAGFFDADLTYVDQDRSAMTPEIEAAATSAAMACATPGG